MLHSFSEQSSQSEVCTWVLLTAMQTTDKQNNRSEPVLFAMHSLHPTFTNVLPPQLTRVYFSTNHPKVLCVVITASDASLSTAHPTPPLPSSNLQPRNHVNPTLTNQPTP